MMLKRISAVLAACAIVGAAGVAVNGGTAASKAYAQSADQPKTKGNSARNVELRRGGYYSYGVEEGAPRARIWLAPMVDLQSPAGPFDSGFFFDSGLYPHYWNNAPYPN